MRNLVVLLVLINHVIAAQNTPFNCNNNAYLFQYNDVYVIDLASGNSYEVAIDITEGNINAAAYNPTDGFIWGSLSTPSKTIVRIDQNFLTTTFYIDELPTSGRYIGDINAQGIYYLKGGGTTYYKIDLDPNSSNYTQHIATEDLSSSLNIHDWAFNAVDGYLYTVEKNSNILYRINTETGVIQNLGAVPILTSLNYTYGAVYFDASGRFYMSANQTGTIYVIQDVQDLDGTNAIDSNLFAFGPSCSSNDGARCPTATVAQEDCSNGIDDDGDGLVDCDDASCSGIAGCPTISPPTSGGNEGGVESNNRLSEQINKRNFNRAKQNYKFDKNKAKTFKKPSHYGKKNSKKLGFNLSDLIPLQVINEEVVIESSPKDLVGITNATHIYSVDYLRNNETVASILLLKTDDGVYEHTKYICDRLLGAELISVSTLKINNQNFIKSIIKNVDGTMEYVLSLSAKPTHNNTSFSIESHWNLDKYEKHVSFYNFQIWTNTIDDLLRLGEEVVRLLEVQKPIVNYNNSLPPTVFVRKGKYSKGSLDLQIINTNGSNKVTFDAGLRRTETSDINYLQSILYLDKKYITNIRLRTGRLSDVGFRIGDGIATPDDLFLSDGPWGIDDSASTTVVNDYEIHPNKNVFKDDVYGIERNLVLKASTQEYISAYRALTPRFKPVDLSDYSSFKCNAKGTGILEIKFIKQSITSWEAQYKTTISLRNHYQEFTIPLTTFTSSLESDLVLNDIVTIVFTMVSRHGNLETKEMHINKLHFSTNKTLLIKNIDETELLDKAIAIPNPMIEHTAIHFVVKQPQDVVLEVYNIIGRLVKRTKIHASKGKNIVKMNRNRLKPGLYFYKIQSINKNQNVIKLIIK